MAVTTNALEYKRLRSYLNPYIAGPNVDAVLNTLAENYSSYLVNNIAAVNDSLYITTASGIYLDQTLAQYGITRPSNLGLADDIYRQIGIQIKNRKQVRDLINNLLDIIFGDQFTKAFSDSATLEPYALQDGDTLLINFDDNQQTATITFSADQFGSIGAALAQEVADVISASLITQGLSGSAIVQNSGNGNFIQLVSDTIGPHSSITVFGGRAQNVFQFPSPDPAGGNMSTQWTISLQPGGNLRYTWTGGANPSLGKVNTGDYVNIYGGGFTSSADEGTYTIIDSKGGVAGASYFEISNPTGTSGIVTQGSDDAVLFYNPVKVTLTSNSSYAALYQVQTNVLQIFVPATTQVIRRGRIGSAHIHYPPYGTFTFSENMIAGDTFEITAANTLVAGTDFEIGVNLAATLVNFVAAINSLTNLVAVTDVFTGDYKIVNLVTIYPQVSTLLLTMIYAGSSGVVSSGPQGDPTSLIPNQQGPYSFDISQPFTVGSVFTNTTSVVNGASSRVLPVVNSSGFPNATGYIILGYGTEEQEGPIPYIAVPSSNTILISPVYTIQNTHPTGTFVNFISQKAPVIPAVDGSDFQFFVTDTVSGREYAESLIQSVAAVGITVVFTVLYPSDIGLGKYGTPNSEISYVYGD